MTEATRALQGQSWQQTQDLASRSYTCGFCDRHTGPNKGFTTQAGPRGACIYICTYCCCPTFFPISDEQYPEISFGDAVENLPEDVHRLYDQARRCMSVQGHTAAALLCRKILMHVAVEKKANPNQTFVEYVDFLASQHIIPAGSKAWVDHIRTRPNLENHEVVIINRDEAEGLIKFTEMLLKIVYEYPAKVPTGGSSPPAAS